MGSRRTETKIGFVLPILKIGNDRLLFWCLSPIVGWAIWGLVVGIPIHLAFGICPSSIVLFLAVQCALQMAVSPWLFEARGSAGDPRHQMMRRTKVVIVWLTLACEAAFVQMFGGEFTDRVAVTIFLGGPVFLGLIFLLVLHWFERRTGWNEAS